MTDIVWRPTPEMVAGARITRFIERCGLPDLDALMARAAADPAWFWAQVTLDLGIDWYAPPKQTLDLSGGAPWARWFAGARMNLAHDCVDKHVETERRNKLAIIYEGEDGQVRKLTYRDLQAEANQLAHGLMSLGVSKGDRVGIYLPLIPEAVAAIMAVAKIGAIFTPIFSGFAPQAAGSRLEDAGVKVLITADGFTRRGKTVHMKTAADEAVAHAPAVQKVVVVRRLGNFVAWQEGRDMWYHDLTGRQPQAFETARLDPEDPFMIIYTSGTTGRPKGAVHVHCGFPLKAAQDMAHCFDVGEQDVVMWFTDLGWMMGPWLIFGTLMLGSTMFLYDGAPDFPQPDRIWTLVEQHGITHLGLSPTVIRALAPHGEHWPAAHNLETLRVLGGTGEPWNPDPYLWFFRHVGGGRCPIINYSGGTETSGGILGCVVTRPLKPCSFNAAIPGMGVAVLDENGVGTVGELALTVPWVGMTRGFWQAPERYIEAYWSRFPGIWVHGDWASVDEDGFWYIHGRSDDTIKIAGKRVGPAEFESVLVSHPAVAEAAAISVPHEIKGETVVCFAVLKPGSGGPSDELARELKDLVAAAMGKPLAPEEVRFVGALPKTRNAKIMRRVIKAAYLGKDPGDLSALENPDAVAEITRV
ncbi:MAG: Acetate--CoA ligase [Symbiobacteriaceae bacterium]|nr:Acetate--CoA ligase [Symbiobacteriaceae bacterium]